MHRVALVFAYLGGAVVAAVGIMSAVSICPSSVGYAAIVPGVLVAGVIALAQAVIGPRAGAADA